MKYNQPKFSVFFAHQNTKNDPNAENPNLFHATPLQPETCPILALAFNIFTKQWTRENDQLLFGDRESYAYQSPYRVLKTVLKDIGDEISRMRLDPHKIGIDSGLVGIQFATTKQLLLIFFGPLLSEIC